MHKKFLATLWKAALYIVRIGGDTVTRRNHRKVTTPDVRSEGPPEVTELYNDLF